MLRVLRSRISLATAAVAFFAFALPASGQSLPAIRSGGLFVTPVPGIPFSAAADQEATQFLADGTVYRRQTAAFIARDSRGRIHNELREVLPVPSNRKPAVLSIHIYDPETRLNTFLNPATLIARQQTFSNPPAAAPPANWAQHASAHSSSTDVQDEDLGTRLMKGVEVHGYRRTLLLAGSISGTNRPLLVRDEYWYSDDLHINLVTKHSDPRSGDLNIVVKRIDRGEPSPDLFEIPAGYKLVNMTPPEREARDQ